MTRRRGLLRRARELDNRVLGSADSRRGWWVNLFLGLNPYLVYLYVAAAVVNLLFLAVRASNGGNWPDSLGNVLWLTVLIYVSRSLPPRWQSQKSS